MEIDVPGPAGGIFVGANGFHRSVDEILEDPASFVSGDVFTAIEITTSKEPGSRSVLSRKIDSNELCNGWLEWPSDSPPSDCHRMKLLFVPSSNPKASIYPLATSRRVLQHLLSRMHIPLVYVEVLPQHNARYLHIQAPDTEGYVLHMRNPGFSFVTTYDRNSRNSYGLVFGLEATKVQLLEKKLKTRDLESWPPAIVSVCLLEEKTAWLDYTATICYNKLVKTEGTIGTHSDQFLSPINRAPGWVERLDFETIARDLTTISTSVSRVDHQARIGESMIRIVERSYRMFMKDHLDSRGDLMTRIDQLWSSFQVLRHEAEFYTRRTEANRQTVYSLIAQKDNRTNFKISEELKVMAEASAQDSTAMVFISLVTLFFLPATFLSSLFSTTFFNFQYPVPSTVSSFQWLYWAITLPLTMALWLIYLLWTKRKQRNINRRLGAPAPRDIDEKTGSSA
jgi:hypothetical protein